MDVLLYFLYAALLLGFFNASAKSPWTWSSSINSILQSSLLPPDFELQSDENSLLQSLTAGAQLALEHCQKEFQWERWNCPDSVYSRRGRQMLTKETAFVSAITAAGIIYSIARNCSRGQLQGCGCRNATRLAASPTVGLQAPFRIDCLDDLVFAEKVAAEFLQSLERDSRDFMAAINLHNYVVGKEAVRDSVRQDCRCQGLTAFCRNKACHLQVGSFQDVTGRLRDAYEVARRVDWNTAISTPLLPSDNVLLFLSESPDYCQPNNTTDWPGTLKRQCSRATGPGVTKSERRSCFNLCRSCGHIKRRYQRTKFYKCKCKFQWCCSVSCQQCSKVVHEHYCEARPSSELL